MPPCEDLDWTGTRGEEDKEDNCRGIKAGRISYLSLPLVARIPWPITFGRTRSLGKGTRCVLGPYIYSELNSCT